MTATPARIGFITTEFRRVVSENASVKAQFGGLARQSEDPVETFFDSTADAQVMADERQSLLSAIRRRFTVTVQGVEEIAALNYRGALPVAYYRDSERGMDRSMMIGDIAIDFGKQNAAVSIWG